MENNTDHNLYPVHLKLRIDWSELDIFEHVNNVSYFKYIQAARINYWEKTGISELRDKLNIFPILASSKCDFRKSLTYPGEIRVESSIESIGKTSFVMAHRIFNKDVLAATARDVLVMLNYNTGEKDSLPKSIVNQIESLERRKFH